MYWIFLSGLFRKTVVIHAATIQEGIDKIPLVTRGRVTYKITIDKEG